MVSPARQATLQLLCIFMVLLVSVDALSSMRARSVRSKAGRRQTASVTIPSEWFGDFSEAESTYTTEGLDSSRRDPIFAVKHGNDPSKEMPYINEEVLTSEYFHEPESAGPVEAWQRHDLDSTPQNRWRETADGLVQGYNPTPRGSLVNGEQLTSDAVWFDNSIQQIDSFGRQKVPTPEDGHLYINGWEERSVNTTVTCATPGCTGRSSLQLFDGGKEEAKHCRLSIHVHPTDFDNDDSLENVAFWKVNEYIAVRECSPGINICNATDKKPDVLHPCVTELNVDKIVDDAGTVVLEGKISDMVDECPYKDNLLSGVATATCMVRSKPAPAPAPAPTPFQESALLQCDTPGCTAETLLAIDPDVLNKTGGKCVLNVSLFQTDFDSEDTEQIEFISVEGTNITKAALKPGKNPCQMKSEGKDIADADRVYSAIKSYDVTKLIRTGKINVSSKISGKVDECDHEGQLLYANVSVICDIGA